MKVKETYTRSFLKTFTWRVFASLDTALLTWFFSGDVITGLKVGVRGGNKINYLFFT